MRTLTHAAGLCHVHQFPVLILGGNRFVRHQRLNVLVEDISLLVRQILESLKCRVDGLLGCQIDAKFLQSLFKCIAT